MDDNFRHSLDAVSDPARSALAAVPADGIPLASIPKAVFVGTAGDLTLRAVDDSQPVTFRNLAAGTILPVRAAEIRATGTTAADLVLLV